jgi:cell division protein FtsQ
LQQVETGAGVWTVATAQTVPQAPAHLSRRALQQRYHRRLKIRRRARLLGVWLPAAAAAFFVSGIIAVGLAEEREIPIRSTLKAPIERALEWAGFGLHQVALSGTRFTSDSDVYEALDLARARTLLGFDAGAAKVRIEALPWVERVAITRVLPDGLDVVVTERQPFAVLQQGNRNAIIDRNGRRLAAVPADAMPGLARVTGEGAESAAPALFAVLAQYPALSERLQTAERRSDQRWTLHLSRGLVLQLPREEQGEALARASVLVASGILDTGEIDLRVAGRDFLGSRKKSPVKPPKAADAQPKSGKS